MCIPLKLIPALNPYPTISVIRFEGFLYEQKPPVIIQLHSNRVQSRFETMYLSGTAKIDMLRKKYYFHPCHLITSVQTCSVWSVSVFRPVLCDLCPCSDLSSLISVCVQTCPVWLSRLNLNCMMLWKYFDLYWKREKSKPGCSLHISSLILQILRFLSNLNMFGVLLRNFMKIYCWLRHMFLAVRTS